MDTQNSELSAEDIAYLRLLLREPEALGAFIDALPDPRAVTVLKTFAPVLLRSWSRRLKHSHLPA